MQEDKPTDEELLKLADEALNKLKAIEQKGDWVKFNDKPCQMFSMQIGDRSVSRGEAKVSYPMKEVFEILCLNQTIKQANSQLKEIKDLYVVPSAPRKTKVNYYQYHGIWPVEGRDFVCIEVCCIEGDTAYIADQSCQYPYPKQNKVTRAIVNTGGYVLKKIDESNTLIIYISDADLCGSIPGMIKNQISKQEASLPAKVVEKVLDKKLKK